MKRLFSNDILLIFVLAVSGNDWCWIQSQGQAQSPAFYWPLWCSAPLLHQMPAFGTPYTAKCGLSNSLCFCPINCSEGSTRLPEWDCCFHMANSIIWQQDITLNKSALHLSSGLKPSSALMQTCTNPFPVLDASSSTTAQLSPIWITDRLLTFISQVK